MSFHAASAQEDGAAIKEILQGLKLPQKELPCKYFYDKRGSELFDRICSLDEYYQTRTEASILAEHGAEMAAYLGDPESMELIELGSGSSVKTRLLLDRLAGLARYVPLDISREHLLESSAALRAEYPRLRVDPVVADYTRAFDVGGESSLRRIFFFPGSTIGNLEAPAAAALLSRLRELAGNDGGLLIGFDLKKDRATLESAYNDRLGVTAEFNLNVLVRLNRELGTDFPVDKFVHRAFYREREGRIEMHLECTGSMSVTVGGEPVHLVKGETIHTENSHKYSPEDFDGMAEKAGFVPVRTWLDRRRLFGVSWLSVRA